MTRARINQTVQVILYGASAACFVLSLCTPGLLYGLFGMPFFLMVVSAAHEFGHAAGCLVNKNTVTSIRTALFTVEKKRIFINEKIFFGGYCAFIKSENDAPVYLAGPLASLICFLPCLLWWLGARPDPTAFLCMLVTALHVLRNSLPFGHTDLRLFLKELKKGDPKT